MVASAVALLLMGKLKRLEERRTAAADSRQILENSPTTSGCDMRDQ